MSATFDEMPESDANVIENFSVKLGTARHGRLRYLIKIPVTQLQTESLMQMIKPKRLDMKYPLQVVEVMEMSSILKKMQVQWGRNVLEIAALQRGLLLESRQVLVSSKCLMTQLLASELVAQMRLP